MDQMRCKGNVDPVASVDGPNIIDHWFSRSDFLEKSHQSTRHENPTEQSQFTNQQLVQLGNLIQAAAINLLKASITCKTLLNHR